MFVLMSILSVRRGRRSFKVCLPRINYTKLNEARPIFD